MLTLKAYQEKAVEKLIDSTCDALKLDERKIQLLLRAPTGSGKTVTMAAFLSQLVQEVRLRPNLPSDIAFIWLAPNTLHLQSYNTLKWFYSELHDLRALQIDDLQNNSELQPKDLLFVNWASVDKEKNTFRKENEQNYNLETLIEKTYNQGTEIIVIIDEAHLSAFTGAQAKKVLQMINAKIEISVTATPDHRPDRTVFISRQEVIEAEMIKKGIKLNIDLKPEEQMGDNVLRLILKKAINKRDEIAEEYRKLGININPLLLIQMPSDTVALSSLDKSMRENIESHLKVMNDITTDNGLLAIWLSDAKDKINLEGLESPNAMQKVLIFKQAISQGWDCPRASVLISLREIGKVNFGIQTVGRILRMPEQKHYDNEILDFGYVYTNIQSNLITFTADDLDYFNMNVAKRKDNIVNCNLNSSFIINDRPHTGTLSSDFENLFFEIVENEFGIQQLPEEDLSTSAISDKVTQQINSNRSALIQKIWNLDVDNIDINIPTDIKIDNYDVNTIIPVNEPNIGHFARTPMELDELLSRFCYDSITVLNKSKSWKLLKRTLIHFCEYYLSLDEYQARKILLYPQNKEKISELIRSALESYDAWLKEKGNKNKRLENLNWELPPERIYSESYKKNEAIDYHALDPFYENINQSLPEKKFIELLERNQKFIEWWYKNGDKGKQHFSISYTNYSNELSLFYVDFVIYFKSGKIGLFDTKTRRSDFEAPLKHNSLLTYVKAENEKNNNSTYFGGIIIPEEIGGVIKFRYHPESITDTRDLTGWNFFNPEEY